MPNGRSRGGLSLIFQAESQGPVLLADFVSMMGPLEAAFIQYVKTRGLRARLELEEVQISSILATLATLFDIADLTYEHRDILGGFIQHLSDVLEILRHRTARPVVSGTAAARSAIIAFAGPVIAGRITVVNIYVQGSNDQRFTLDEQAARAILPKASPSAETAAKTDVLWHDAGEQFTGRAIVTSLQSGWCVLLPAKDLTYKGPFSITTLGESSADFPREGEFELTGYLREVAPGLRTFLATAWTSLHREWPAYVATARFISGRWYAQQKDGHLFRIISARDRDPSLHAEGLYVFRSHGPTQSGTIQIESARAVRQGTADLGERPDLSEP